MDHARQNTMCLTGSNVHIAEGVSIQGTIRASGVVRIDGRVRGEIAAQGDVVIGPRGVVAAQVAADNVIVAGELRGTVSASGRLHVLAGGKLFGTAKVGLLIVEDGALFKGKCEMELRRPGEPPQRLVRTVDNTRGRTLRRDRWTGEEGGLL